MASAVTGAEEVKTSDADGDEGLQLKSDFVSEAGDEDVQQRKLQLKGYPDELVDVLESNLESVGLDVHPLLIGWYNEKVGPKFQLNYPEDTLAFVVISGPNVFERCIVPYVQARLLEDPKFETNNPLDDSMKHAFGIVKEDLESAGYQVETFHDFDLHPSRRPKVLVQTAAHVAGAVQYFHKNFLPDDLQIKRFSEKSDLSGVAIHPRYGGWYAIRGVIILPGVNETNEDFYLSKPQPLEIFTRIETIAKVIELFAYHWETNEWRDMHTGSGVKYSDAFINYLDKDPTKRWEYVRNYCCQSLNIGNLETT